MGRLLTGRPFFVPGRGAVHLVPALGKIGFVPVVEVTGGVRIHYRLDGPSGGEPLVLIMGLGWDLRGWDPMMPYLPGFRVLRVDNRGVGRSDTPAAFTIVDMARDIVAAMDVAGFKAAHVYGASLGSMIAQELAIAYPERVRSLILGCPSPGVVSFPGSPGILATLMTQRRYSREQAFQRIAPYLFGRSLSERPEAVQEAMRVRLGRRPNFAGMRAQLNATLRWSSLRRLGRIKAPTLVIHGDRDRLLPIQNGRLIARLVPHARLHVLEGAGHIYSVDAPAEHLRVVVDFLREQSARAQAAS